jgi:hypothetical protein
MQETESDRRDLPDVFGGVGIARTTGRQAAMLWKIGRIGFFCVLPRVPTMPTACVETHEGRRDSGLCHLSRLLRRLGLGLI